MSIRVMWDDEAQTTLRWEFVGAWTWEEFEAAVTAAACQMSAVPYTVTAICDFTRSGPLPLTGSAISQAYRAREHTKGQLSSVALVGASAYIKSLLALFCTIHRQRKDRYVFAETVEEARALMATRAALPATERPGSP